MINNDSLQDSNIKRNIYAEPNKENTNNNALFDIKRNNDSNIQFGNKIYRLTEPDEEIPPFRRNCIFIVFLLSNLFLNYDTGVIPAALIEITKEI